MEEIKFMEEIKINIINNYAITYMNKVKEEIINVLEDSYVLN